MGRHPKTFTSDDIGHGVDDVAMFGEPPADVTRAWAAVQILIHRQNTVFPAVWLLRDGQDVMASL
jgi:hypothetical protein